MPTAPIPMKIYREARQERKGLLKAFLRALGGDYFLSGSYKMAYRPASRASWQVMQKVAQGLASNRSGLMGLPQRSQVP